MIDSPAAAAIADGQYDRVFRGLYPKEPLSFHRDRWTQLIERHGERTGNKDVRLFSAPGRTELAGNHTDHNGGRVLAAGIHLDTIAAVSASENPIAEVVSEGHLPVRVDLSDLRKLPEESGKASSLVRGIAASIERRGGRIGGFTATTTSRILKGSGLSSSAAFEVLIASIFGTLYSTGRFGPLELARIGQEAENDYFGKPSGLMDQCACAFGGAVAIDFSNPAKPEAAPLEADFAAAGYTLAVVDTRGDHSDLTPDYASVPREMRTSAAHLGADVLAETAEEDFYAALPAIRAEAGDRAVLRAIHFFDENRRVEEMTKALKDGDITAYLDGVRRSGDSSYRFLQNLYSPDHPRDQPLPLALALTERFLAGEGAARVHGGGFAGTVQVFVPIRRFSDYSEYMERYFGPLCVVEISLRRPPAGELLPE